MILNLATDPFARVTSMPWPRCKSRSRKNTPGPECESMCPAMIAAPTAPGRGPPVNHPAIAALTGTCSVSLLVIPSGVSLVLTPIAGMTSLTGAGTFRWLAPPGACAVSPSGTGIWTA